MGGSFFILLHLLSLLMEKKPSPEATWLTHFFVVIFNPGSDTHVRKPGFSNVLGKCTLTLGDKQEGGGWEWLWVDPQEQSHLLIKHLE